jgi:hypothetical protein
MVEEPQVSCDPRVQSIEKFEQPIQWLEPERRGVLMVMIPRADMPFGNNHQQKIAK